MIYAVVGINRFGYEFEWGIQVSTTPQINATNITSRNMDSEMKTMLNLLRDDGDFIIGQGFRHPFPEKIEAIQRADEKRKRDEENKHKIHLDALQDRISDLQSEIAALERQIAEKEREWERLRLQKERTDRQIAENREKIEQMRRDGQEDSPEYIALIAQTENLSGQSEEFRNEMEQTQEEIDALREEFSQKNLELNAAIEEYERKAEEGVDLNITADSTDTVFIARDRSQNIDIIEATEREYTERKSNGGGIEHRGDDDFMEMFSSARDLEMNKNFNLAASGEVQSLANEQVHDMNLSGAQITINPMG